MGSFVFLKVIFLIACMVPTLCHLRNGKLTSLLLLITGPVGIYASKLNKTIIFLFVFSFIYRLKLLLMWSIFVSSLQINSLMILLRYTIIEYSFVFYRTRTKRYFCSYLDRIKCLLITYFFWQLIRTRYPSNEKRLFDDVLGIFT